MKKSSRGRMLALILAVLLAAGLFAGCNTDGGTSSAESQIAEETPAPPKIFKIGLIQYAEHASLDTVREAFMNRLEEWGYDETKILIDYQNAGGDMANVQTICDRFVTNEVDLIVPISTPAAKAAVEAVKGTDIKVVFAAVENPKEDLGMKNLEEPEGNITGTVDSLPVQKIIDLALQVNPNLKTMGLLYNPQETNSAAAIEKAKAYCKEKGLETLEGTITSANELQAVSEDLFSQCDAVFTPADNTVASAISVVTGEAKAAKKPLYGASDSMVKDGALAAVSIDYTELGAKNADMAVRIMEGESVAKVPVDVFTDDSIYINQTTYEALKASIPAETLETAVFFQ